jgi:hypothetical protein
MFCLSVLDAFSVLTNISSQKIYITKILYIIWNVLMVSAKIAKMISVTQGKCLDIFGNRCWKIHVYFVEDPYRYIGKQINRKL